EHIDPLALAYSADGRLLAMGRRMDQPAIVLHVDLPMAVPLDAEHPPFMCISFLGDTHLVVGDTGELWDGDKGSRVGRLTELADRGGSATALTTGSRRNLLVAGHVCGELYVWHAGTRKLLYHFKAFEASIMAVALSEDGRMLAAGCADIGLNDQPGHAEIKIWKLPAGD